MIANQYTVALPADYDMSIIRRRVADKGSAYDTFPGLHLKAFLIRERGHHGAPGNEYAPFYVWRNTEALMSFVAGDGFRGIIDSFGRTPIRVWLPLDVAARAIVRSAAVRAATREIIAISPGTDLTHLRQTEITNNADALTGNAVIAARVVAVNTERWQLIRFALMACRQKELELNTGTDSFEVLHLSAPGLR